MAEGWYCPGCKAHHGPHVDTCPKANESSKLGPAVAGWAAPPVVGVPMPPVHPDPWSPNRIYCGGGGAIAQTQVRQAWNGA